MGASGLLELRKPILYGERDSRIGGQFGRRCGKISVNVRVEVPLTYRNAFLWGCANHVKDLDHEVMLQFRTNTGDTEHDHINHENQGRETQ